MPIRWISVVLQLLLVAGLAVGFGLPSSHAALPSFFQQFLHRPPATPQATTQALAVLQAINRYRARYHLAPLQMDPRLNQAAQSQADYMAATRQIEHVWPNGTNPGDRVRAAGYPWRRIGENIAMGQESAEEVVQDWINSPHHRANLLKPGVTDLGVGYKNSYWALTLAGQN